MRSRVGRNSQTKPRESLRRPSANVSLQDSTRQFRITAQEGETHFCADSGARECRPIPGARTHGNPLNTTSERENCLSLFTQVRRNGSRKPSLNGLVWISIWPPPYALEDNTAT